MRFKKNIEKMRFDELPEGIRVKLDEDDERQLWSEVGCIGVRKAAEKTGYTASKIYNWKNKDVFLPADFVSEFIAVDFAKALKGGGRSQPVQNIGFPLDVSDELLTRVELSVSVNREGVPVYSTQDRGLKNRFIELLSQIGPVPFRTYSRNAFEIRYPKYLQQIFDQMNFETDFAAAIDEKGILQDDQIILDDRKMAVNEFDGTLHSRDKKLELALALGDSEKVAEIISEESEIIRNLT